PSAVVRHPIGAEFFGLKITQLVAPSSGNRFEPLAEWKEEFLRTFTLHGSYTQLVNENDFAALGIIGSLGFLILIARLLYRNATSPQSRLKDALALLNVFAILLGTIGGFGTLVSYIAVPWIRAYNRLSIFIGFFALAMIALLLDSAARKYMTTIKGKLIGSMLLGILVLFGVR